MLMLMFRPEISKVASELSKPDWFSWCSLKVILLLCALVKNDEQCYVTFTPINKIRECDWRITWKTQFLHSVFSEGTEVQRTNFPSAVTCSLVHCWRSSVTLLPITFSKATKGVVMCSLLPCYCSVLFLDSTVLLLGPGSGEWLGGGGRQMWTMPSAFPWRPGFLTEENRLSLVKHVFQSIRKKVKNGSAYFCFIQLSFSWDPRKKCCFVCVWNVFLAYKSDFLCTLFIYNFLLCMWLN